MNTLKQFLSRLFASKWYYNLDNTMRIHKVTGDVEYLNQDDWGAWYEPEPMVENAYLPLRSVALRSVQ